MVGAVLLGATRVLAGGGPGALVTPVSYLEAFREGRAGEAVQGLAGRIVRGRNPEDFEKLSEDPLRRAVFVMGEDGLQQLLGLEGRDVLRKIGYTEDYIDHLLGKGTHFRLLVFPRGPEVVEATWEGVTELTRRVYPEVGELVSKGLPVLRKLAFAQLQAQSPSPWSEADRAGRGHPEFWSAERLGGSDGAPWKVRAFLYHELHLTELFAGDGWTRTPEGPRGLREYLTANREVASIPGAEWLELEP